MTSPSPAPISRVPSASSRILGDSNGQYLQASQSIGISVLNSKLHKYALLGKRSKLKSLLKNNLECINIDALDIDGYTALYLACLNKRKHCVKILLEANANPNETCKNGENSLHAAAISGSVKILKLLLEYGGDLRYQDHEGRTPKHYALFKNPNPGPRRKMLSFIEEARSQTFERTSSVKPSKPLTITTTESQPTSNLPRFNPPPPPPPPPMPIPLLPPHSNNNYHIIHANPLKSALVNSNTAASGSANNCHNNFAVNSVSTGFGPLFKSKDNEELGVPVMLPIVNETDLVHDSHGVTINNGSFMVYESMKWKDSHLVTIKRLHSKVAEGGNVNLLIDELNSYRRVNNFPKLVTLMGFCQTENVENMILMFERIAVGSLFHILHEIKLAKKPKLKSINSIMLNVCDALVYMHEKNLIHCYVNSHSIFLTHHHMAKLANLEYAVERANDLNKQKKSKVSENRYRNCAWNWMAPELMAEEMPNELSDMYGFCVIIWELFNTSIPWDGMNWCDIYQQVLREHKTLLVDFNLIPLPFSRIIKDGFSTNSMQRMSFEEVKGLLENFEQTLETQKYLLKQHQKHQKDLNESKLRNNSFSEGIADLNEAINSNEMATLNSIEELDKFSQLSGSFICCDAYKTEVHLTKGIRSSSKVNRITRSHSSNRNLDGKKFKENFNSNNNVESTELNKPKKRTKSSSSTKVRQNNYEVDAKKIENDFIKKKSFEPHQTKGIPPPPPPPPPPLPTSKLLKNDKKLIQENDKFQSSPPTNQLLSKSNQHNKKSCDLPPTPPPTISQLQKKFNSNNNNCSIMSKNGSITSTPQNTNNLPLPPSFLISPLPTPTSKDLNSRLYSKSVDSPRTPCTKNDNNNYCNVDTSNQQSNSIVRKSELFEKIVARLERRNSSLNDLNQEDLNENDNLNSNEQLDTSLSLLKRDKFKLLENIYRLDPNIINQNNKEKLFNLIQRRQQVTAQHLIMQHQQQQQQLQQQREESSINSNVVSNRLNQQQQAQTSELEREQEIERINRFNSNFNKFDSFCNNMQRPTPDDKKRYFSNLSKNIQSNANTNNNNNSIKNSHLNESQKVLSPIKKLDMSTLSQEDNTIEKSAYDQRQQQVRNRKNFDSNYNQDNNSNMINNNHQEQSRNSLYQRHQQELKKKQVAEENSQNNNINNMIKSVPRSGSYNPYSNTSNNTLNSQANESIAATSSGLLKSIKAISKDSIHLMDTQTFYQMANQINQEDENNTHCFSKSSKNNMIKSSSNMESSHNHQKVTLSAHKNSSTDRHEIKPINRLKSSSISNDITNMSQINNKQPQQPNSRYISDILNGGSVKSLVQSYEEFPHKEPTDSKIIQMREERKKEIDSVVEQCRLAYTNEKSPVDEDNNFYDDEERENQIPDEKLQQQQNRMQKELSTISERTENSPPGIINIESGRISRIGDTSNNKQILTMTAATANLATSSFANNTNSTTAMVSALNSNTRETSSTKPIRHLDMNNTNTTTATNRFNFLDSNNTLSGGDMPSSNNNNPTSNNTNKYRGTEDYKNKVSDEKDRQNGVDYDYSNNTGTLASASTIQTVKESPNFKYTNPNSNNNNNHIECESDFSGDEEEDNDSDDEEDSVEDDEDDSDINDYEQNNIIPKQKEDEYGCQYKSNNSKNYGDQHKNQFMMNNKNQSDINKNTNTKSFYSSQEDLLSSLNSHGNGDNVTSIECSEGVFLNDFDNLASKNYKNNLKLQKKQQDKHEKILDINKSSNYIYNENLFTTNIGKKSPFLVNQPPINQEENDDESESFPSAPPPPTPKSILSQPKKSDGGTVTASIGLGPNQMVTNTYARVNHNQQVKEQHPPTKIQKQNLYQHFSVDQKKKSPQSNNDFNIYSSYSSSCSNAESNSVSSSSLSNLYEAKHRYSLENDCNETKSKLSNVRLDKHVIDTRKFKGYSYKLETRSNVTNQYHIKSLLTNEQTGHQLLLANTKVQTPNILTKVIIDQ